MNTGEVRVAGTLHADGTLQLDEMPNIAPGRVTIALRRERQTVQDQPPGEAFFRLMDEIWAGQKARGFVLRAVDEVETERQRLQAEAEEEIEAAIHLQEERRKGTQLVREGIAKTSCVPFASLASRIDLQPNPMKSRGHLAW